MFLGEPSLCLRGWCVPKTVRFASDLERPEGKGQRKTTVRESEGQEGGQQGVRAGNGKDMVCFPMARMVK